MTIAVLMTIAPAASDAATFQYFRMYGGGQGGTVVSPPPVPTGTLSYSVAGPSTATVGVPYSASASVAGAVGAATFSVFSGSFPPGLSLNATSGAISGTPSTAGSYSSILAVTDSTGAQGFATFVLAVAPALAVSGSPSTVGTVGREYAAQFSATSGSAPYTFSSSSSLPPGLSLLRRQRKHRVINRPKASAGPTPVVDNDGPSAQCAAGLASSALNPRGT